MRDRSLWRHVLPAIFIITALILGPAGAQAQTWVQAGMLRCRLNPSIGFVIFGHQSMECSFRPVSGPVQGYEGAINTVDLDLGVSEGGNSLGRSLVQQAECHMAHWRENTSGLPATSASALAQGRTSLWGAQIEVSPYSQCRSKDRLHSMLSRACRNSKLRPVQQ